MLSRGTHSLDTMWDFPALGQLQLKASGKAQNRPEADLGAGADPAWGEEGRYFHPCDAHLDLHVSRVTP